MSCLTSVSQTKKHGTIVHQNFKNHVSFYKNLIYLPSTLQQEGALIFLKASLSSLSISLNPCFFSISFQTLFVFNLVLFSSPPFQSLSNSLFSPVYSLPLNSTKAELSEAINDLTAISKRSSILKSFYALVSIKYFLASFKNMLFAGISSFIWISMFPNSDLFSQSAFSPDNSSTRQQAKDFQLCRSPTRVYNIPSILE